MGDFDFVLPPEIHEAVSACIEERDLLRAENEMLRKTIEYAIGWADKHWPAHLKGYMEYALRGEGSDGRTRTL